MTRYRNWSSGLKLTGDLESETAPSQAAALYRQEEIEREKRELEAARVRNAQLREQILYESSQVATPVDSYGVESRKNPASMDNALRPFAVFYDYSDSFTEGIHEGPQVVVTAWPHGRDNPSIPVVFTPTSTCFIPLNALLISSDMPGPNLAGSASVHPEGTLTSDLSGVRRISSFSQSSSESQGDFCPSPQRPALVQRKNQKLTNVFKLVKWPKRKAT